MNGSDTPGHDDLLAELLALADQLGLEVRRGAMGGEGGGLAVLRGQRILFVDTDALPDTQLEKTAAGLSRLGGELESIYLRPAVRSLLGMDEGEA